MSVLEGREMLQGGVPVQFCPWVHLCQRWKMLERELQLDSPQPKEEHGTQRPVSQVSPSKSTGTLTLLELLTRKICMCVYMYTVKPFQT